MLKKYVQDIYIYNLIFFIIYELSEKYWRIDR